MATALAGIRVVEVGQYVTGPEAGVLLADLGAEVIKVESPSKGDPFRNWFKGGYAPNFCSLNRNKRSLALNVASPEGTEILLKLLDTSDILIQNFRAGQAEKWGWGYETVKARNPGIIYCSISGFGPGGPYADRPGFDTVGVAMSGLLSLLTDLSDPKPMGISMSDHLGGIYAAYGVLGALVARERTGVGQRVDTSLLQSSVAFLAESIAGYFSTGRVPRQDSRAKEAYVFAYVAKDDKPFVIHLSAPPKFWESLVTVMGRRDWITDDRYGEREARRRNYDALDREMREIFRTRNRDEWIADLVAADVPCSAINTLEEVFEDPQVDYLNMQRTIKHPVMGEVTLAAPGVMLSETPLEWELAPPMLGEHTEELLRQLGYEQSEIDRLRQRGMIRTGPDQ